MEPTALMEAIREMGHDPRSYSGRGMGGARCVAVDLDNLRDLWRLAQAIPEAPAPETDSMGMGIVAYWPRIAWPVGSAGSGQ